MGWTQEDIDALRQAIREGNKRVQVGGVSLEKYSLAEMMGLLARMEREVNGQSGHTYGVVKKGL